MAVEIVDSVHKVLIVGKDARAHALGWGIKNSKGVDQVYFAPGNAGTGRNIDIAENEVDRLAAFARDRRIDLTVVSSERPLASGIVDAFRESDLRIFGPSKKAAFLEADKADALLFMEAFGIPCPKSWIFSDANAAHGFVGGIDGPIVIKASSLADGKGVFLPDIISKAHAHIDDISLGRVNGVIGDRIIIQERLSGKEISLIIVTDGDSYKLMVPAQDYKRAFDHDRGPNTGGMGAYAPRDVSQKALAIIEKQIIIPTLKGLKDSDIKFSGALYFGIMETVDGPKVLEYNVRFGDPETQVQVLLLQSSFADLLLGTAQGTLAQVPIQFRDGAAVCVVLAEEGYPDAYETGHIISGLNKIKDPDVVVFHAGTRREKGKVVTAGGRVLSVSAQGSTLPDAVLRSYGAVLEINGGFQTSANRRDIGVITVI